MQVCMGTGMHTCHMMQGGQQWSICCLPQTPGLNAMAQSAALLLLFLATLQLGLFHSRLLLSECLLMVCKLFLQRRLVVE